MDGRHERPGLPEVPNGLTLCKTHHSAYDVNILGVSPDYRVVILSEAKDLADVLREHDGPMLRWGLQEMDRAELWVPGREEQRPNRESWRRGLGGSGRRRPDLLLREHVATE